MIVIGDAGGTTTHWRIIHKDGSIQQAQTMGLNVMHQSIDDYIAGISSSIQPYIFANKVYFYTAGFTNSSDQRKKLHLTLGQLFKSADIHIENDLLAAARGLCGHQPGWIGILGTGANVAYYDGKDVHRQVPPLGYLLGDEGSGAYIGKLLLTAYLRKELPKDIQQQLYSHSKMTEDQMLGELYQSNSPKSFLASYAEFVKGLIKTEYIYQLVYDSFSRHFEVFLTKKKDDLPVHYTGSVAFHFSDVLRQVAVDRGIALGHLAQNPIAGLALYHQKQ